MNSESFVAFLDRYGAANPPSLRYREDDDFGAWQGRFRAALETLRGPVPERVPLVVEELASVEEASHRRLTLRVQVNAFSALIAYLLVPLDLQPGEKRPGLIASHGHVPLGIDTTCGVRGMDDPDDRRRAYALDAVNSGYVVLAPAWWGWTGRDGHWGADRVGRDKCNVIQMAAAMYGLNVMSLHIEDGRAAVDVLASRPEVDAGRLGCVGNSYGGRTAMWMAIYEPRLRASVASGCMNTFRERSLKLASCGIQYLPGLLRYGDVGELFSLIAPRPLQLQSGQKDELLNAADREAMAVTVRQAYDLSGAPEKLEIHGHPGGHFLQWPAAHSFLQQHL